MKLNVLDRLALLVILPKESNYLTLAISKAISQKVELTDKEREEIIITSGPDGRLSWQKDIERDFEFSEAEAGIICDQLGKLDSEKRLTIDQTGIYRKFKGH